ncbi:MFS transporter [Cerasicoccus frondis]|uniref:MFS transporter n=1 Tax=Cerasicoccus frondis TaxID=490090 RepID=UPI002852D7F1|nr:MFS transporter [Cerasicoccus frondis]
MNQNPDNAATTYRYDIWRAPFQGVCESTAAVATLIAIRGFGAEEGGAADTIKSLLNAAPFIGLLLTTVFLAIAGRTGYRATSIVAFYLTICGGLLILSSMAGGIIGFTACFVGAYIIFTQQAPMMIRAYSNNYTPYERGQRVSTVLLIGSGSSAAFSFLGSRLLDWKFDWFPVILIFLGVACLVNAVLVRKIPSPPLEHAETGNPLRSIKLAWKDQLFGWLLASWMLMGFANLMTIPIRVEILANPEYGINASNEQVMLATMVIPQIAGLISAKFWGALFDRMNFIFWRLCVNTCFFVGMLLYFNGPSLWVVYLGATLLGMGMGGGRIGWNLWVTKIAPLNKVSAYMSIHTMLTGVRGVCAPFIGYVVLTAFSPPAVGWLSASLIFLSSAMFGMLRRNERFNRVL